MNIKKTLFFNSIPKNYYKECSDLKRNTIRKFENIKDLDDERIQILEDFINKKWRLVEVIIQNTFSGEHFVRNVTDVTKWEGYYIISW